MCGGRIGAEPADDIVLAAIESFGLPHPVAEEIAREYRRWVVAQASGRSPRSLREAGRDGP